MDSGASSNSLYYHCFHKMGLEDQMLRTTPMKFEIFTTHEVTTRGIITLNVTLEVDSTYKTEELQFYVVDVQSIYKAILGIPTQVAFDVVISVSHQG